MYKREINPLPLMCSWPGAGNQTDDLSVAGRQPPPGPWQLGLCYPFITVICVPREAKFLLNHPRFYWLKLSLRMYETATVEGDIAFCIIFLCTLIIKNKLLEWNLITQRKSVHMDRKFHAYYVGHSHGPHPSTSILCLPVISWSVVCLSFVFLASVFT